MPFLKRKKKCTIASIADKKCFADSSDDTDRVISEIKKGDYSIKDYSVPSYLISMINKIESESESEGDFVTT